MRRAFVLPLSVLAAAVLLSLISATADAQVVGSLPSGGTSAREVRGEATTETVAGSVVTTRTGRSLVASFRALPLRSWLAVWKAQHVAPRRHGFTF